MRSTNSPIRRLLLVSAALLVSPMASMVLCAGTADATIVGVRARDASGAVDNRLTETEPPFNPLLVSVDIDVDPVSGIHGFAQAFASLGDGTVKVFVTNDLQSSTATPDAIAQLRETIWLVGTPDLGGTAFSFSIAAYVDGYVLLDSSANAFFTLQIGSPRISPFASPHTVRYDPGFSGTEVVVRSFATGVPVDSCDSRGVCRSQAIEINAVLEARLSGGAGAVDFFCFPSSPDPTSHLCGGPGGTAALALSLGPGVGFTSASGAFLTAAADTTPPTTTASRSRLPNAAGWNNSDVTVTLTATDDQAGSGVKSIQFSLSGAQGGSGIVQGDAASVAITAEGTTTLAYFATDNAGNAEASKTLTVRIDKTPPMLTCDVSPGQLWPPNHRLIPVKASVVETDALSGAAGFTLVSVTSSEGDTTAADIQGFAVGTPSLSGQLRAERSGNGAGRVYTLVYRGQDLAGNSATCSTAVTVPHDQR